MRSALAAGLALPLLAAAALAHDYSRGGVFVDHPWTPVATTGPAAVYFALTNRGASADRLLSATTPRARAVELHERVAGEPGATRVAAGGVPLPAGATLALEGGAHRLVLVDPQLPLREGETFPLRLRFERAGDLPVTVFVEDRQPRGGRAP